MSEQPELTPDEWLELESLLRGTAGEFRRTLSLDELLAEWSKMVREIEEGYGFSIYEYTNDLWARDRLERLIRDASIGLRAKLTDALAPIDQRFLDATEPASRALGPQENPELWWRRVPTRREGEFADDLAVFGHIGVLPEALALDRRAAPLVFNVSGPVPSGPLREWAARQARTIPADLIALWEQIGGGEIFESEEIYAPGVDPEYEIDVANRDLRERRGLPGEYLVFHAGISLTAVDPEGRLVQLDREAFAPIGSFASAADWYADLRGEHGHTYGLRH